MKKRSLMLAATLLAGSAASTVAWGHGSMEVPLSRAFSCYKEGPESLDSAACKEAARVGGTQPIYDWNAISQNAAGNDKAFVPDGMLCSGGNVKYRGFDLPRTDWKKTQIQGDENGIFQFVYRGTAPHATKRFDFYITKDSYDPTKALTWDDLEPAPFCQHGSVPLENGRYYMDCRLPADKTGDHVIYNIWERSDSPETFYSCIDVTIGQGGSTGGDDDTDPDDDGSNGDHDHGDHGGHDGGHDGGNDSGNNGGSDGASCQGEAFVSGSQYQAGDIVTNAGGAYECVIAGWCSNSADWAYEPGVGLYWQEAWKTAECEPADNNGGDHGGHDNGDDSGSDGDSGSDNGSGDHDGGDHGGNDGNDGSDDNSGAQCPAFVSGTAYSAGDQVANVNRSFQCVIGGWCSSTADWAFAPGKGLFWGIAWKEIADCTAGDDGHHGGDDQSGDNGSDNGSGDNDTGTDDGSDNGNTDDGNSDNDNGDNGNSDNGNSDDNSDDGNSDDGNADSGKPVTDHVVASYFVEWGVYGRNYHVMDMPGDKLTHVLYAFLPICGPNDSLRQANPGGYSALVQQCAGKQDYEVVVHDKFAALEKSYPGDRWDDPIRGNFGQLIRFKQKYPHIKILPSVGGWTLSDPFYSMANNAQNREIFVNSVIEFLKTYDFFDGIDIDWEYPGGGGANGSLGSWQDRKGYADLMRDLRLALDNLEAQTGRDYQLTSAVGSAPSKISAVDYAQAQTHMDYIFAMTYDYYGAWSGVLGHHAALYDYANNTNDGFYAAATISNLMQAGVPAQKLVLGVAQYGRGWKNVSGYQANDPFSGTGGGKAQGTWEAGVLDYKDIVSNYLGGSNGNGINGYRYYYDETAEAPYLWNANTGTLITYENPRSVQAKGAYVLRHNLGGLFAWEIDADNGDIVKAMVESLQTP